MSIASLSSIIRDRKLSVPDSFKAATPSELEAIYNGIGPERWSKRFRGFVTRVLYHFEACALIHDYEYTLSPKTRWRFLIANLRFGLNSIINAFYNHDTGKAILQEIWFGLLLTLICQLSGYQAYTAPNKKVSP